MESRLNMGKLIFILKISIGFSCFFKLVCNTFLLFCYARFGFFKTLITRNNADFYRFKIDGVQYFIHLRKIDLAIFYEVFYKQTYFIPNGNIPKKSIIIDLGAHVGLTAQYYINQYKPTFYLAIEVDRNNFYLLEKNTKSLNTINQNVAISENNLPKYQTKSDVSYNHKVSTTGNDLSLVQTTTMDKVIRKYGLEKIDLLKIDIEGGEQALLKNAESWIHQVDHIIIELHEAYSIEQFCNDIEKHGFAVNRPNDVKGLKMIWAKRVM